MASAMASQRKILSGAFIYKMRKIITIILSLALAGSVLSFGGKCLANDTTIKFTALGGTVREGYINRTNTGFNISGLIANIPDFSYAELLIGGVKQEYRTTGNYLFGQSNLSPSDMTVWFPEGVVEIELNIYDISNVVISTSSTTVIVDYTLNQPAAGVLYDVSPETINGFLKVGDAIGITLNSDEELGLFSKFYDRELCWKETLSAGGYQYQSQYTVQEGDRDISMPSNFSIIYEDEAGNKGVMQQDLGRNLDANAPTIKLNSVREGQLFNQNKVRVFFEANEVLSGYEIYLDGKKLNIRNGDNIEGIKEGNHVLQIEATDEAGNTSEQKVNFAVDLTAPPAQINGELGSSYSQGDQLILEGTTEPGSQVVVEINSEVVRYLTTADLQGRWKIAINTADLETGEHRVYLEVTDPAGNKTRVLLGLFSLLIATETANEPAQVVAPVKLARTDSVAVVSDAAPVYRQAVADEQKVATEPKISAAMDERNTGINWSAWLILFGLVAVSFLVAGVSYYGYAQATTIIDRQKSARAENLGKNITDDIPQEEPIPPSVTSASHKQDTGDWKIEDKPEAGEILDEAEEAGEETETDETKDEDDIEVRW